MATIREADEHDLRAIISLWNGLIAYHCGLDGRFWERAADGDEKIRLWMMEAIEKADRLLLVADQEGVAVAFLHGIVRNSPTPMAPRLSGYITDVVVSEERAHQRIGTALVAAAERWFSDQGAEDVTMTVAVHNQRGKAFWRKNGFEPWTETMHKRLKVGTSS
jgi:ribosomal protein S18 acetylase RimI-like enzyme